MYKKTKKLLAWALVVSMMLTQLIFTNAAFAATNRLYGLDRYETAIKISQDGWENGSSDYAVLAYGETFPDALAAAPLAAKYDAPILLTGKASLTSGVLAELQRLGVENVFIVGGEGVVAPAVAAELTTAGMTVERLSGLDRYETALAVANKIGTTDTVVVAYGENYPDALAVSAVAALNGWPILLTDVNSMDADVKAFIGSKKAYVIGGTGVVSDTVLNALANGERVSGADRAATNVAILEKFAADLDFAKVFVATNDGFADALTGAALAAKTASPLVLVGYYMAAADYAATKVTAESAVVALGGPAVVSDAKVAAVKNEAPVVVPGELKVESVSALNLKQIKVEFSKEVDKTSAENPNKYRFNGSYLDVNDSVKLQSDKKSVVITLGGANAATASRKMDNNTSYDFKVEPVVDAAGQFSAAYTTTVKNADSTIPSVSSVQVTGSKTLKVVFNEPVYDGVNNDYTIDPLRFSVDDGIYPVVSAEYKASINAVEVVLYTALPEGSHTLKVKPDSTNAIVDYAGYKPLEQSVTFAVVADSTAPVATIKSATDTAVTVVFSKSIDPAKFVNNANVRIRHSYDQTLSGSANEVDGTSVAAVANTSDKEYIITFGASKVLPVGANKLFIGYKDSTGTKIQDKFGNSFVAAAIDMTVAQDVTAPTASVLFVDKNTIDVTFSEDVVGANVATNYTIKDKDQNPVAINGAPSKISGTNTYRITTQSELNGGNYTVAVANIKDSSLKANTMAATTLTFTATDASAPQVSRVVVYEAGKKVRIYFSEDMSDAGLTDKGNYSYVVNAGAVTALTAVDAVNKINSKTVEIVFGAAKAGLVDGTLTDQVVVSGSLKDLAGNRLSSALTITAAVGTDEANLAVVADAGETKKAVATGKRAIEFKLNRLVTSVDAAKFTVNGIANTVSSASAVNDTVTGKATIKLSMSADLDTDLGTIFTIDFEAGAFTTLLGATNAQIVGALANTDIKDKIAPLALTAADIVTKDINGNNQIDEIWVTYSENIQTTSVAASDYTVEGYVVNDVSVAGNVVKIKVKELGVVDNNATPKVTQVGEVADDSAQHNVLGTQSALTATDGI